VPGMKADLNVIDYENLKLEELKVVNGLSAGGARIRQGASGYLATLIDGVVTRLKDEDTAVRPGRLLRS
jgi:N-acyl-D-amino-acid deacylase